MGQGVVTPVEVADLVTDLRALAARFDADAFALVEVEGVIGDLGRAVRIVAGMATLMARRASDITGATAADGAAALLARTTGTTPAQAKRDLATSTRLRGQAGVADAVRKGELSAVQAEAVADAVAADPTAEADLLAAAAEQSVPDLRRTCRDTRANADPDPGATRRRHLARRSLRAWHAADGEWKATLSGPADHGARFEAALRAEHDRTFRQAHAEGRREEDSCYRYDALLTVLEQGAGISAPPDAAEGSARARRSGRQTKVIVTVDAAALTRGRVADGETCHIAGIGPVSLEAVRALIPDAHLAYVIRDATDVSVAHLGRQVTAHQRTAMEARGYECEVPHCRSTHLLEIDHIRDWAHSRQTILALLAWLCGPHHDHKTTRGYRLTGPPGQRTWTDPDGHIISQDPPPPATTTDVGDTDADRVAMDLDHRTAAEPDERTGSRGLDASPVTAARTWVDDLPDFTPEVGHLNGRPITGDANHNRPSLTAQIRRHRTLRRARWRPPRPTAPHPRVRPP